MHLPDSFSGGPRRSPGFQAPSGPSHQSMSTTYAGGPGSDVTTNLPRTGLRLPNMAAMMRMFMQSAPDQGKAISQAAPINTGQGTEGQRTAIRSGGDFGSYTFPGGSGVLQPYKPGQLMSPGAGLFATRGA